jgi:transcriptional regulator with XRE-family HTH domain
MREPKPSEAVRILDRAQALSGLSQKALARRAGVSPETLSRIRRRGTADFSTVLGVARVAGIDLLAGPRAGAAGSGAAGEESSHRRLDDRSLALHAVIAGRLLANPALVQSRVLPNIRRFKSLHAGTGSVRLLELWESAAQAGVLELLRVCVDPSERGKQLRQASPLTGLLLAGERRAVYESFAA